MLNHIGHDVFGVNTVQLYMKVPGSRTPGKGCRRIQNEQMIVRYYEDHGIKTYCHGNRKYLFF